MPRAAADPAGSTPARAAADPGTRPTDAPHASASEQALASADGPSGAHASEASGLSRRAAEFAVSGLLFGLAMLVIWDNQRIGAGWTDTGPASGYFPMRLGIVLAVCAIATFAQALREQSQELFATWLQLKRVAQVLVPLTVYVALIAPLGIYAASTLFIAAFMVFAGRYPAWKGGAVALATNLLLFFVFEIQFKVPLPKGPIEAMFGY
ncbi:small permease of tripartite tricarboxylate transporter [Roseateles aquatilis]|uniref:Small permease of tripartite tricarboxylate transporter n=2 Tax=Roseateles aquatilis TaxID=431061 RepID=A0A246JFF9_9BURK|nr:small permease of tripartite tricarboxylate transporter [Roseateles aquatilis]